MTNIDINIWGRIFTCRVKYRCHNGETVTQEQINTFNKFIKQTKAIEVAKYKVESFCRNQVLMDDKNKKKDNIFSYIMPDYIFVDREIEPHVAIMCNYRYDPEHGLAIVFDANGNVTVGTQDIIL